VSQQVHACRGIRVHHLRLLSELHIAGQDNLPSQKPEWTERVSSRAAWGLGSASTGEEIVCARYLLSCLASCPCHRETKGDTLAM